MTRLHLTSGPQLKYASGMPQQQRTYRASKRYRCSISGAAYENSVVRHVLDLSVSLYNPLKLCCRWLGVDLAFQNTEDELSNLPGCYTGPEGSILLASVEASQNAFSIVPFCCVSRHLA